ncbi:MAG: DUF58 domain-containing protein [Gemmataceae bacterium]|nr:DUF58 domain-containing protein [Gemmataceae bacterium]
MLPTRTTVWLFVLPLLLWLLPVLAAGGSWLFGQALSLVTSAEPTPFNPSFDAIRTLTWVQMAIQGGLLLCFLLDAALTRRGAVLRVRRERAARLSLGTENELALVIENTGRGTVRLIARDETPPSFRIDPPLLHGTVPSHGIVRLPYKLLPTDRGDFTFGNVHLRCRGPLGLAWVDRTIEARETVPVYPNLLEVRRYEALVRSTLVRSGGYRSRRLLGAGREFSHFREYTIDDDFRSVNWKATARRGKPITSVYESEHSQDIIFCLDVGRMMAARVGALTKLDHAINAVLMLTHVSQAFQDNLGLLVFSHTVHRYIPPAKGRAQHAQFLQALYSVQPELCYVNYREAFSYLIAEHPKRALTMIFTDLLDTVVSAEYRDAMRLLRQFHLLLTLAVADVPLQDLAARTPEAVGDMYDVLVARDLLSERAELLRSLERQGVMVLDTVPDRLTVDAVNRYLSLKTGVRT